MKLAFISLLIAAAIVILAVFSYIWTYNYVLGFGSINTTIQVNEDLSIELYINNTFIKSYANVEALSGPNGLIDILDKRLE